MTTFKIETHRFAFFHRAFLWVSSVGFAITGGKPIFNVTLQESRHPINQPWYMSDAKYQKFTAGVGHSTTARGLSYF